MFSSGSVNKTQIPAEGREVLFALQVSLRSGIWRDTGRSRREDELPRNEVWGRGQCGSCLRGDSSDTSTAPLSLLLRDGSSLGLPMEAGEAEGPRDFKPITLQEGVLWVQDIKAVQSQPSYLMRLYGCGSSCVQQPQEMLSLLNSFGLNPATPKSSQRAFPTGLCEPRLLLPGSFPSWGGSISPAHSP